MLLSGIEPPTCSKLDAKRNANSTSAWLRLDDRGDRAATLNQWYWTFYITTARMGAQMQQRAPGVKIGGFLFCSGQTGGTPDLEVVFDPEAQFVAAWQNLKIVLHEGGCSLDDIVELTTYHVDIEDHLQLYKDVRDRFLPRARSTWTAVCVTDLAHPALLIELRCIAVSPEKA
jgi:enamine deaminase RidA (YjgF/YER057c/UK114 family)